MTSPGSNRTVSAGTGDVGGPPWQRAPLATAPTPRHPRIPHWRRPIARLNVDIKFGVCAGGSIISGVSEPEIDLLALLDGSLSIDASYRLAVDAGVPARRWRSLLELVEDLGVLERSDSPALATPVILAGRGDLVDEVSLALRRDGIGSVIRAGSGADVPVPASSGPESPHCRAAPPLAILVGPMALDPRSGDPWLRQGVTHLPVVADGPRATIGPFVEAGLRGPCLWCLDLHRTDRDPSWPLLVAQGCGSPGDVVRRDATHDPDPVLAQLIAGSVALLARGHVSGRPAPVGVSVEISLPWPRMDHRRWSIHPHCRRRHHTGV